MYLGYNKENTDNVFCIDIETESLTPNIIWCAVIKNLKTEEVWKFRNDGTNSIYKDLKEFIDTCPKSTWIGHNALSFDIPIINRLCGVSISLDSVVDTLVLSFLYNPALDGGHSLAVYGERLGLPKIEFDDWTKFSEEQLVYCERDVDLTIKVFWALQARMKQIGFSELSCEIEHKIRHIIDQQQETGFYIDKVRAKNLYNHLRGRESDLSEVIHKLFPPELKEVGKYTFRVKKDGSNFASYERHRDSYTLKHHDDGTYSIYELEPFNIGSPKQRVARLLSLGWEPTSFTPKGFPKVDEDSLVAFSKKSGEPAIQAMADWLVCNGRANMVGTWLGYIGPDSRIHGRVLSCGAATRRMVHFFPNSANIPSAAKAKYGHECRELWTVEPDQDLCLVGADASGLENVGLLHYLNNKEATEVLNRPKPNDVHSANSRALTALLGREVDREWGAKTSWYAWLYGAYPPKLGSIVKGPPSDGELIINTFFKTVPGLKALIDSVQSEWKRNKGLLKTIDGGYVRCPSVNAALNYKIQSLGAIVMKLASIILHDEAARIGLWFRQVGNIHDEFQLEVHQLDAEEVGKLAVWSMEEAARQLKFRVPLTGAYKIGSSWAETH